MLVEFEAGGYTLRMKSILACVHGRDRQRIQRLPGGRLRERRPPDHAVAHAAVVERGGGFHQPER